MKQRDSLYVNPHDTIGDFIFDEKVADVFEDMIQRSVPGYRAIVATIGVLAREYVQADSRCYDLGCSLGASTLSMRRSIVQSGVDIVAVDNSEAMIAKCRSALERESCDIPVQFLCEDIRDVAIEKASMVVLNFTLQFIDPSRRAKLLAAICQGMRPGGVLVISDKIAFESSQEQAFQMELHHAFKTLKRLQ